ncbi:DUF2127 domain-containing protein [Leptothrix sp. BB-4]
MVRAATHLRAIAGLEAFKGLLALGLLTALVRLPAAELGRGMVQITGLLGLHPVDPTLTPVPFVSTTSLTLLVAAYASIRLLEAWGLWRERRWGVWLGATSGAIYLPVELGHILRGPGWLNVSVLTFNVALVGYLMWRLWRQERATPSLLRAA